VITKTMPAMPVFSQPVIMLCTRLTPPPIPDRLVRRERLLALLEKGTRGKLTLLSAPAGAGKTALLTDWLAHHPGPAAWLTLDKGDNDPLRFFSYLFNALDTLPGSEGDFSALLSNPYNAYEDLLASVLNRLAERTEPAVLILDDYHTIQNQILHDGLVFLLDGLPEGLRIMIATREDLPLPLGRLRAAGQLAEIGGRELRFTVPETKEFFRIAAGLDLPPHDLADLEVRTEGWAAGLQMAGLTLGRMGGSVVVQSAFSGRQHQVMDFLTEEVLTCQPERVRSFLVQASIFERFNADLCQAVFHDSIFPAGEARDTSAAAMLEYCQKSNLFVQPLMGEPGWFRFQKFFLELLRSHLDQAGPEKVKIYQLRAAAWFESRGNFAEAVQYALAAGDFELAAGMIERSLDALLMRCEFAALLQLTAAFPAGWVVEREALAICRAWAVSYSAIKEDLEGLLQSVERRPDSNPSYQGYTAAIRARLAEIAGDSAAAVSHSLQALEYIPAGSALRPVITFFLGEAAFYAGDFKSTRKYMRETASNGRASGNLAIAVSATCRLAKVAKFEGRLRQAEDLYREARDLMAEGRLGGMPFLAGMVEVGMADLYREWDRLEDARRQLEILTDRTGAVHNPNVLVFGLITACGLESLRGNEEAAAALLRQADKIADRHHLFFDITGQWEGMRLQRRLSSGEERQVREWLEDCAGEESGVSPFSSALSRLNQSRGMIALGRLDDAHHILADLTVAAELAGLDGLHIEINLLLALTYMAQGKNTPALQALHQALILGEPQNYRRTFLDKGKGLISLLKLGIKREMWTMDSYGGGLLTEMEADLTARESRSGLHPKEIKPAADLVEPLTAREIEILRLMADGYSNSEIASELVLSVGTVKAHLHHIFGKLGVDGRIRAIQKGKELNLI
jgi:LuxR family transcriptional regulator, maltose regulon positive regulatory protein